MATDPTDTLPLPSSNSSQATERDFSSLAALPPLSPLPPPPARPRAAFGAHASRALVPGYDVLDVLGRGGMAVVYKARQHGLNRVVALKMILAGANASAEEHVRFRVEAEAVASLRHPNIVQIFEVGEENGLPYYSLELVEGGNLDDKLEQGPMVPEEIARIVEKLARAMHAAHQRGVIHRDLKPSNVLMTTDGEPKIADFGLAKRMDKDMGCTQTGAVLGTPSYMAPEQALGKKNIGPTTDIYGLGTILYEALSGRPPFRESTLLTTVSQVIANEPTPPRKLREGIPRDLEVICLKCLEKDPKRRYASAEDLADDLKRFQHHEPIAARPPGPFGKVDRWARKQPHLAAVLTGLLLTYGSHTLLMLLGVPGEGGFFHWFVTVLVVCWALGAVVLSRIGLRHPNRQWAHYAWEAMNVGSLTIIQLQDKGPSGPNILLYFLMLVASALRFRVSLLWFTTVCVLFCYFGLLADAVWRRPELIPPTKDIVIFVLCVVLIAMEQHMMLRRIRAAFTD